MGVAHRDLKPENFMLSSNKPDAIAKVGLYIHTVHLCATHPFNSVDP
jgi:serine/threonine protein kinase